MTAPLQPCKGWFITSYAQALRISTNPISVTSDIHLPNLQATPYTLNPTPYPPRPSNQPSTNSQADGLLKTPSFRWVYKTLNPKPYDQADGLLKTSSFRWVFYTTHGASEVSRYEFNNLDSSGVSALLQRHRQGRLPLLHLRPPE